MGNDMLPIVIIAVLLTIGVLVGFGIYTGTIDFDGIRGNEPSVDICQSFDLNYPGEIDQLQEACENFDGTFKCEPDQIGCYSITGWNSDVGCSSAGFQSMKALCAGLNSEWTCTATDISCEKFE